MGKLKFQVFQRRNVMGLKRWYFRLRAGNGEIIAQSEAYTRKENAIYAATFIRANADNAAVEVMG